MFLVGMGRLLKKRLLNNFFPPWYRLSLWNRFKRIRKLLWEVDKLISKTFFGNMENISWLL